MADFRNNIRLARLFDAQDLLGTYMLLSAVNFLNDYHYNLTERMRAWQIILLPLALTSLVGGKSVTSVVVEALDLPRFLDSEQELNHKYDNEYLQWIVQQVNPMMPLHLEHKFELITVPGESAHSVRLHSSSFLADLHSRLRDRESLRNSRKRKLSRLVIIGVSGRGRGYHTLVETTRSWGDSRELTTELQSQFLWLAE